MYFRAVMKKLLFAGLVFILATSLTPNLQAQINQGGIPRSAKKIVRTDDVPVLSPGTIDLAKLQQEDIERSALGKEFDRRFGFNFFVEWNTENSGRWVNLPNGDRIWQLRISCPEAFSINLTFSKYKLPAGADLFIIGQKNRIGAFTSINNQSDEKLGTGILGGDEVLLEYYEPFYAKGSGKLEIGRVTHGYRNPFSTLGWGQSQSCEMNVNCPAGAPWKNEKRSIAKIIDGGDLCTGALINNVLMDGKPYFLTANHCFNNNTSTWVFAFNWEAPGCSTPSVSFPETETVSGSIVRAKNAFSDFCLLELSSKPPTSYNVYYSGWSAEDVPSQSSTIIHHPSGDIKKISFDENPVTSSGYGVGSTNDNSHWQVGNYELATTTEGGSSGSPIYDQNHRIVGQLHGGPASCTNISSDFYGKVSKSWETGTTPATRLRDWLDPNGSGLLVLNGFDPACKKADVNLPWKKNLDTVTNALPHLWKIRNPNADSGFVFVNGGYPNMTGKAFRMVSETTNPIGRGDSLMLSPLGVSRYKNLKVKFRHAYRRKNNQDSDTLNLIVSRDCGFSYRKIASWSGTDLVTDASINPSGPFSPADTTLWSSHIQALDSTFNRADQLVFAFGFKSGNAGTLWLDDFEILGDTAKSLPIARFDADKTSGCAGLLVNFSDSSLNNPTAWNWTFEGGTPSSSSLQNQTVVYANPGVFKVTLSVTNDEGLDTLVKSGFITIQDIGTENTPFLQNFANPTATFPINGYLLVNPDNNVSWQVSNNVNAPASLGGSLFFDNWSNPDVTGEKDLLVIPKIMTAGKNHLKVRFKYAYKYYPNTGGVAAPDTLTIGRGADCGGSFIPFWKKGGQDLATAGSTTASYTPVAGDWKSVLLNLDSLLIYPEVALGFMNTFGYGNRLFIDDISIDTSDSCPSAPIVQSNNDTLCTGQTLVLSMDSVANASYNWSGPGNFNSTNRTSTRVVNAASAGTYQASVTVNGCTSEASSVSLIVVALPGVPVITVTGNTLTGPPGLQYMWILNGNDTLPDNTQSITATVSGTYTLIVRNAAGCPRSSLPKVVTVTAINGRISEGRFMLSPNPAQNRISLSWNGKKPKAVKIMNAIGKSIISETRTSTEEVAEFDLNGLPSGTYWLLITSEKSVTSMPFIKE